MAFSNTEKWLTNNKNSIERQEEFLNRLMVMRESLLDNERENLKSALKRLNNLKYPRRKPMILHSAPTHNQSELVKSISKCLNIEERVSPRSQHRKTRYEHSKMKSNSTNARARLYNVGAAEKMFTLEDSDIVHIAKTLKASAFDDFCSVVKHPDHLPSIPNVGHRSTLASQNRYKKMATRFCNSDTVKNLHIDGKPNKYIALMQYPQHKRDMKRKVQEYVMPKQLRFNVDVKDCSIFRHGNTTNAETRIVPSPVETAKHFSKIPHIFVDSDCGSDKDENDSSVTAGELNHAFQQITKSHSKYQGLREELTEISNIISQLEESVTIENVPK